MRTSTARADYHPAHPVLPQGMTVSHVIELIEKVGRHLRLGAQRRAALIRLIRSTTPSDWTASDRDPVCFEAQQNLAQALGITDRAMRGHERALEEHELVLIDTTANGRRSGRVLQGGRRLGINFRPLIERIHDLMALQEAEHHETNRIKALRLECSAAKRDARQAIERLLEIAPRHQHLAGHLQRFSQWPRRYGGFRSADELEDHLTEINTLIEEVREILSCHEDSSGTAESKIPAILNTNPKILGSCSGSSANMRTARKRADDKLHESAPNGAECREQRIGGPGPNGNPDDLSWLTPELVRSMAGPDFSFYLNSVCPPGEVVTERALRSAAIMILPDLGISPNAWENALNAFGSLRAALLILIIDANRDHPTKPIRNPGGSLVDATRRHLAGRFNYSGSLISLRNRAKNQ